MNRVTGESITIIEEQHVKRNSHTRVGDERRTSEDSIKPAIQGRKIFPAFASHSPLTGPAYRAQDSDNHVVRAYTDPSSRFRKFTRRRSRTSKALRKPEHRGRKFYSTFVKHSLLTGLAYQDQDSDDHVARRANTDTSPRGEKSTRRIPRSRARSQARSENQ